MKTKVNMIRYHATHLVEHSACAYWTKGDDANWHARRLLDCFDKLALLAEGLRAELAQPPADPIDDAIAAQKMEELP